MCSVTLIAAGLLSAASVVQQNQQAKAVSKAAWDNYNVQQETLQTQADQINAQANDQSAERQRQALIERGRLRVASGESGIGGLSMSRLLQESMFNQGQDLAQIEANRKASIDQNKLGLKSAYAQAKGRSNTAGHVSALGAGLQIGGAVGGQYLSEQAKIPSKKVT